MGRDHSIECEVCGASYGGINGPYECPHIDLHDRVSTSVVINESCPCAHTTPCHDRCTCINPVSSSGCGRCCSYGSPDQQRAAAERLAPLADRVTKLRAWAVERLAKARADRETCHVTSLCCYDTEIDALEPVLRILDGGEP